MNKEHAVNRPGERKVDCGQQDFRWRKMKAACSTRRSWMLS